MKPVAKFLINANESTDWKVKVHVWKKLGHMRNATGLMGSVASYRGYSSKKAVKSDVGLFAEMHFTQGEYLTTPIVAHECFHVTIHYSDILRLSIMGDDQANELGAITLERLLTSTLEELRRRKIPVKPI